MSEEKSNEKLFTQEEVNRMANERRERDAQNLREQIEKNKQLAEELERVKQSMQSMHQPAAPAASAAATPPATAHPAGQFYTAEDLRMAQQQAHAQALEHQKIEKEMNEAVQKDPEFNKLLEDNRTKSDANPTKLQGSEAENLSYLPNAPAVIKQLLKDPKELMAYRAALADADKGGIRIAIDYINNLSNKLASTENKPAPSGYKPAADLPDTAGDDDFDEEEYIKNKY